jgi:hypothetical protein
MGRVTLGAALVALLAAGPLRAEVDVQMKEGKVAVRCTAAPLSEVLDRLARATGMKVVQQGVTPTNLVSLRLEDRTPAEAVFGVLEGLGLNYAFVLDAAGKRVETLILAGAAGVKPTVASATPPPPPAQRYVPRRDIPPPAAGPDEAEDVPVDEDVPEEAEAEEEEPPAEANEAAAAGPRGNVLQTPEQPVFPSSPFAPRAPMFMPQPAEPADPKPAPPPKP